MIRKIFWVSLAGVGLALAACTAPTAEPTPQPTQAPPTASVAVVPTSTAVPSVTPPPADTPTATAPATATETATPAEPPTATPPPTPDPNEGAREVVFEDKLDGTGNWFWTSEDEAASFAVTGEDKMLIATAKQSGTWRYVISNDVVNVGDQQVRATVRLDVCAAADAYGLMFRGTADATGAYSMYIFEVNCTGSARLVLLQGADLLALTNWAQSPLIKNAPGEENTLMVWMAKDQLRFYVNDQYLFSAQDATLTSGFYGFFLRDRTNGTMRLAFKDLVAKSVSVP